MARRRRDRRTAARVQSSGPHLGVESLEGRIVLSAAIAYNPATRTVSIVGSEGDDSAQVRRQGGKLVVSLDSDAGRSRRVLNARQVSNITFSGLDGNDTFRNLTAIPSQADGGAGDDVLRGGRGVDLFAGGDGNDQLMGNAGNDTLDGGAGNDAVWGNAGNDEVMGGDGSDKFYGNAGTDRLWGGDGNDELHGGAGNDALHGEAGNDWFDGGTGIDQLVGGDGLDTEVDTEDGLADGDDDADRDGDVLATSGPYPFADDASAAPIIAAVDDPLRNLLGISATDSGLRVRVLINDGTFTQPGRWGDRVTGVWRYLTPDKIQVFGEWTYPASDPSQVNLAVQWNYDGPPGEGDPANFFISEESRLYAGYLNGYTSISWLPGRPASFYYNPIDFYGDNSVPIEALRMGLSSLPNSTLEHWDNGSFSGDFSTSPGFPGLQPVLDLQRTIERAWAARQQVAPRA